MYVIKVEKLYCITKVRDHPTQYRLIDRVTSRLVH